MKLLSLHRDHNARVVSVLSPGMTSYQLFHGYTYLVDVDHATAAFIGSIHVLSLSPA
jgi:hypothetical protein